jgi:hypothetical protein
MDAAAPRPFALLVLALALLALAWSQMILIVPVEVRMCRAADTHFDGSVGCVHCPAAWSSVHAIAPFSTK